MDKDKLLKAVGSAVIASALVCGAETVKAHEHKDTARFYDVHERYDNDRYNDYRNHYDRKNDSYRFDREMDRFSDKMDRVYEDMLRDMDDKIRSCERGNKNDCIQLILMEKFLRNRQYFRR